MTGCPGLELRRRVGPCFFIVDDAFTVYPFCCFVIELFAPLGEAGRCPAELGLVGFLRLPPVYPLVRFWSSSSFDAFLELLGIRGFVLLGLLALELFS